jgi:GMP synthase (glutamine-hydrolysing)
MKLLLIDNTEISDKQYNAPLEAAISSLTDFETLNYKNIPNISDLVSSYCGVVLSGVPLHYSFDCIEQRLPLVEQILNAGLPVLGICLGHESIGRLYGASVIHDQETENGACALTIIQDDPIFQGMNLNFSVETHHRGSITVPSDFMLLASSIKCKNQIMKHREKPIYGFQFHPEFSDTGQIILGNFVQLAKSYCILTTSKPPAEIASLPA